MISATLIYAAQAVMGPAELELTTTDRDGYKGFSSGLKVYIGRNCVNNPSKGFICDFKYQMTIQGQNGKTVKAYRLPDQVRKKHKIIVLKGF